MWAARCLVVRAQRREVGAGKAGEVVVARRRRRLWRRQGGSRSYRLLLTLLL